MSRSGFFLTSRESDSKIDNIQERALLFVIKDHISNLVFCWYPGSTRSEYTLLAIQKIFKSEICS